MKQLLSLFLFLVPCLAWAQYPSNGNQKITLGEQTTSDGLIWRGVIGDTALITPLSDTSAYIILDTANHRFYNYNRATNVWSVAGGGTAVTTFSAGTTGLTPSTATSGSVTLAGTLAVANGGTGSSTLAGASISTGSGTTNYIPKFSATNTLTSSAISEGTGYIQSTKRLELENTAYGIVAYTTSGNRQVSLGRYNGEPAIQAHLLGGTTARQLQINPEGGAVGIGITDPQTGYRLHVVDSVYVGGRVSAAGYTTRSDYNLKHEIQSINYGLYEILQMQPVKYTYKSNGEHQLGFIAQDIGVIIPESVHFDDYMGVDYQSLIPILTKAIQEQQAQIEALKQRLLILENK
jgi:hypothetical protein